jgi:hypothetical protein
MASQAGRLIEPLYNISAEAQNDLFEIWRRIAGDSVDLANRITAVLRGRRDLKRLLEKRL